MSALRKYYFQVLQALKSLQNTITGIFLNLSSKRAIARSSITAVVSFPNTSSESSFSLSLLGVIMNNVSDKYFLSS